MYSKAISFRCTGSAPLLNAARLVGFVQNKPVTARTYLCPPETTVFGHVRILASQAHQLCSKSLVIGLIHSIIHVILTFITSHGANIMAARSTCTRPNASLTVNFAPSMLGKWL